MSDDDDIQYIKRKRVVHFGALDKEGIPDREEAADGNVQISTEFMEMEKSIMPNDKVELLEEFEKRRRVRAITVSTNDAEVKADLRS